MHTYSSFGKNIHVGRKLGPAEQNVTYYPLTNFRHSSRNDRSYKPRYIHYSFLLRLHMDIRLDT